MDDNQLNTERELLGEIYRNAKTGSDSINVLLPRVSHERLKSELSEALASYEDIAAQAEKLLEARGKAAPQYSMKQKLPARASLFVGTMFDTSPAHMAKLMMKSARTGAAVLRGAVSLRGGAIGQEVMALSRSIISLEERNAQRLSDYIRPGTTQG